MEALRRSVLEAPGLTDSAIRRRAFDDAPEAGDTALDQYLGMVRDRSSFITDRAVAALRAAGTAEDTLFELTIAAAAGAAFRRLEAGLRAMGRGEE